MKTRLSLFWKQPPPFWSSHHRFGNISAASLIRNSDVIVSMMRSIRNLFYLESLCGILDKELNCDRRSCRRILCFLPRPVGRHYEKINMSLSNANQPLFVSMDCREALWPSVPKKETISAQPTTKRQAGYQSWRSRSSRKPRSPKTSVKRSPK